MACPGTTLMSYLSCFIPHDRGYTGLVLYIPPDAPLLTLSLQHDQRALIVGAGKILLVTVGG